MKSMSYITIVLILSCFSLAQFDPGNLPTEQVFGQIKEITMALVDYYKNEILYIFDSLPEFPQMWKIIDQETSNFHICLIPYQERVVNSFRLFHDIFKYLGAPDSHLEQADTTYLSDKIFTVFSEIHFAIKGCLNDSILIGPFLSDLFATVTSKSIKKVLDDDGNKMSYKIHNYYIGIIAKLYQNGSYRQCGYRMAILYCMLNYIPSPIHVNPMEKPDSVLWNFLKKTVNGFMNQINYKRMETFSSDPNEYQVWQSIVNEMNMIKTCFDDNPIPILIVFKGIGSVLNYLGAPNYKYESADINYLSLVISYKMIQGIEAITPCATSSSIIMPYLNEMKNQVTIASIFTKLNDKKNQSNEINYALKVITGLFDYWKVFSSGEHFAKLYFFFNPLVPSTNRKSPANYTTAELMLPIAQMVNGFVDMIIQARTDKNYYSNPNEPMIAEAIRNEVKSVMNCLQKYPEPIANTFRMLAGLIITFEAPSFHFEYAQKNILANQLYDIFWSGYSAINICLNARPTIQPYMNSLNYYTTFESILNKLNSLINRSDKINEHLQAVMLHFNRGEFFSAGVYFGILWFIANPLDEYHQLRSSSSNDVTVNGIAVARAEVLMNLYSADNALLKTITLSNNY